MLKTFRFSIPALLLMIAAGSASNAMAQSGDPTLAPPAMGEETKGTPAMPEGQTEEAAEPVEQPQQQTSEEEDQNTSALSALGTATITESRRESGQIYRIELEHSLGSKQYIEELDSDGKIESTSNDIEETPNLPKWRIGSW